MRSLTKKVYEALGPRPRRIKSVAHELSLTQGQVKTCILELMAADPPKAREDTVDGARVYIGIRK